MKLIDFVKKEPNRARLAIIVLSVMLTTTASALIFGGAALAYTHKQERDTTALLTASDILSLKDAYAAADADSVRVLQSLVALRTPSFLGEADADALTRLLHAQSPAFFAFCGELESAVRNGRFSREAFIEILRTTVRSNGGGALARAAETRRTEKVYQNIFAKTDADARAAEFLGIMDIFTAEGECAYCKNVYIEFFVGSDSVYRYAAQYAVESVALSERECVLLAKEYASGRLGMEIYGVGDVSLKDGVFFVDLKDKKERLVRVGIRGDTGETVFLLQKEGM